jgi:hypothetical protein
VRAVKSGGTFFEFELSCDRHTNLPGGVFTVTALFKTPPVHLMAETRRALVHACQSPALLPEAVTQAHRRAIQEIA